MTRFPGDSSRGMGIHPRHPEPRRRRIDPIAALVWWVAIPALVIGFWVGVAALIR